MKINKVTVKNFRSLDAFSVTLDGETAFIIGECSVGKTTLLTAIFRGLGQERGFTKADFVNVDKAIEIELLLTEFDSEQRSTLCDRINFSDGSLTVGVRVTWDADEDEAVCEHGYPERNWIRSNPAERSALEVQWFTADRQVAKYLQLGSRKNLMAKLLETLSLEGEIEQAIESLSIVSDTLGGANELQESLRHARESVSKMLPDVAENLLRVSSVASNDLQILRLLELCVAHHGEAISVGQQSSGVAQLVSFAFLVELVKAQPGTILLIDQPELSLHPQPQRSLVRLFQSLPCQLVVATHSSNILDRVDPRKVVCLKRRDSNVECSRVVGVTDEEARIFARYTTPQTAEAFFAKSVVLVEGVSDLYSLVALAEKQGRDLDAEGVSIVDMEGGGGFKTFVKLFGPKGFNLELAGLCDMDHEGNWAGVLQDAGLVTLQERSSLENVGFYVCDADLEDELVRAFGEANVQELIEEVGETSAFQRFCKDPKHKEKSKRDQVREFISKGRRKVRYGPLIVERLPLSNIPGPLEGVLASV